MEDKYSSLEEFCKDFETVWETNVERFISKAYEITKDKGIAEQIVQDAAVKAMEKYETFTKGTNMAGWLYTIVRNATINYYRRAKKIATMTIDNKIIYVLEGNAPDPTEPDPYHTHVDYEYLDDELIDAVCHISEEFQKVLFLAASKEGSHQNIANELDIPLGTVMSRLSRARKQVLDYTERHHPEYYKTHSGRQPKVSND